MKTYIGDIPGREIVAAIQKAQAVRPDVKRLFGEVKGNNHVALFKCD